MEHIDAPRIKTVKSLRRAAAGIVAVSVCLLASGVWIEALQCRNSLDAAAWAVELDDKMTAENGKGFWQGRSPREQLAGDTCPGVWRHSGASTDYVTLNWREIGGPLLVPGNDFPLIYDASLSNHLWLGVNVVTVGGRAFWDFRGRWIKGFIKKHPQFKIKPPSC